MPLPSKVQIIQRGALEQHFFLCLCVHTRARHYFVTIARALPKFMLPEHAKRIYGGQLDPKKSIRLTLGPSALRTLFLSYFTALLVFRRRTQPSQMRVCRRRTSLRSLIIPGIRTAHERRAMRCWARAHPMGCDWWDDDDDDGDGRLRGLLRLAWPHG